MLLTSLAIAALAQTKAPALTPGMKAPDLAVGGWLKGDAPKPAKGRFRVVEFWATWCVPCKAAMPHLSELARKHAARLDVVGVSVLEYPQATRPYIQRFVDGMGKDMDYRVAYDTPKGTMSANWLTAAGLNSIPATFLLDDAGTVLWIGHPNGLEAQLETAFAGKSDVAANRAAFLVGSNWLEKSQAAVAKAAEAYRSGRKDEAEKGWNEALALWPKAAFIVRKSRLDTYPVGSPESAAVVEGFVSGGSVDRETAIKFARDLPPSEKARAEGIVDRALAGKPDYVLLRAAAVAYNRLGAYPKAIGAVDAGMVQIEAFLADPARAPLRPLNEQWKEVFVKLRAEAVEKSRPQP